MSFFKKETKNCIVKTDADLNKFIAAIVNRTVSFFEEEVQIKVINANYKFHEENYIDLKRLTSIISVNDYLKMTVAFNYDASLLHEIFIRYTKNIILKEGETQFYIEEVAKDLINNIIGNVLSRFGQPGVVFEISTPIIVKGEKYVANFKYIKLYTTKIKTELGEMSIFCILPGTLFLNQVCGIKGACTDEKP
jgi:CheY-specific phosphatase CheX